MRFVDASVFLHAYLRPNAKRLPQNIENLKRNARKIVGRIVEGEDTQTSVIHLCEIANILESGSSIKETTDILDGLLALPNLDVLEVSKEIYESAIEESIAFRIGVNDSLAIHLMRKHDISEIYSFDSDFDRISGLRRMYE